MAIRQQENMFQKLIRTEKPAREDLEKLKSALEITRLDRDVLVTFVNRILIYEDKRVFLELRAKNMFADVLKTEKGNGQERWLGNE